MFSSYLLPLLNNIVHCVFFVYLTHSFIFSEPQVKNKSEFLSILDDYNFGDKVVLKIQRGVENLNIPVVLEEESKSW